MEFKLVLNMAVLQDGIVVSEPWALQRLFWLARDVLLSWPLLLESELEFELL